MLFKRTIRNGLSACIRLGYAKLASHWLAYFMISLSLFVAESQSFTTGVVMACLGATLKAMASLGLGKLWALIEAD